MKRKLLGFEDIDDQIADRTYFPINYPLIRLEDVMLMYAEIVGPTDKAISLVKLIQERAGVSTIPSSVTPEKFAEIVDMEHIDRGYPHIVEKFRSLGADIRRVVR